MTRDVLLNKILGALTNPWYLILCLLAGIVDMSARHADRPALRIAQAGPAGADQR